MNSQRLEMSSPYFLSILRIVAGLLYMQHGMQKYFLYPPGGHQEGPFNLFSLFGIAGTLELFGGALLALGLFTRPVAFLLSGQMAVAYWLIHFPMGLTQPGGLFPVVNGGDLAILFCFLFLYFVFAGPGAWSVDRHLAANRAGNPSIAAD
jgi:putative oxidoreductase